MADAIIAATAVTHTEGRVYTDDPHFEKIPGIHTLWGRAWTLPRWLESTGNLDRIYPS